MNDLVKINNDRIALYQKALEQANGIDSYLQEMFTNIIKEAECFRQQLMQKTQQSNTKKTTTLIGKIYTAWFDLKLSFKVDTQKTVISSYLYNEEVALQVYKAALGMYNDMGSEIFQLIEKQKNALRANYDNIKNFRETCRSINYSVLHF